MRECRPFCVLGAKYPLDNSVIMCLFLWTLAEAASFGNLSRCDETLQLTTVAPSLEIWNNVCGVVDLDLRMSQERQRRSLTLLKTSKRSTDSSWIRAASAYVLYTNTVTPR